MVFGSLGTQRIYYGYHRSTAHVFSLCHYRQYVLLVLRGGCYSSPLIRRDYHIHFQPVNVELPGQLLDLLLVFFFHLTRISPCFYLIGFMVVLSLFPLASGTRFSDTYPGI